MRGLTVILACLLASFSCDSRPTDVEAADPEPFFEIGVAAIPDSVSVGDSVLVQWTVTNVGRAPGVIRGFTLGLGPIRDLTGLQSDLLFCGIGNCSIQLGPGEEIAREEWWVPRGQVAAVAVAMVRVTYRAPGASLVGFDHVWVGP